MTRWTCYGIVFGLLLAGAAAQAGEGFSLSSLNPFGGSGAAGQISDEPAGDEAWLQGVARPEDNPLHAPEPQQPSAWQKFSSGTQSFFRKTGEVLMPWRTPSDEAPPPPTPRGYKPAESGFQASSLLPWNWFQDEPAREPQDVNDFLSQPRVPLP